MTESYHQKISISRSTITCILFIATLCIFILGHFSSVGGRLDWAASTLAQAGALSDIGSFRPEHPLHLFLSKLMSSALSAFELPHYFYASSLSFLSASITVTIVYLLFCRPNINQNIHRQIWSLLFCAFLITVPIFWFQATETSAFSLHCALLAGVWLLLVKHQQEDDVLLLFMAVLLAALAISNHIMAIFFILGIGGYIIAGQKKTVNLKQLLSVSIISFFIFGLAPYIYFFPDQLLSGFGNYFSKQHPENSVLHSISKPLWVVSGLIGTILLLLGLWQMTCSRAYNLVVFAVIIVLGHILYGMLVVTGHPILYMAAVAFMFVVCSIWSLESPNFIVRIIVRSLVVAGLVLNLFIVSTTATTKPVVDKISFIDQVLEHLQDSQRILMEHSRENHALVTYYNAATGYTFPVVWVGEETNLASEHVAVSYLSPDPGSTSTHRAYNEAPITIPNCCGLDGPIFITRLFTVQYIYQKGDVLKFGYEDEGRHVLSDGFNKPESWGVWSDGSHASLTVPFATVGEGALTPDKPIKMLLQLGAFTSDANPEIQVYLKANGRHIAYWAFNINSSNIREQGGLTRHVVYLPPGIAPDGVLKLDFEISGTASPEDLDLGQDSRQLGIEIIEMRLIPVQNDSSLALAIVNTDSTLVPTTTPYSYRKGDVLKFDHASNGRNVLSDGFSKPESWGVWSDGPRASLNIPFVVDGEGAIDPNSQIKLLLNLGAFVRASNPEIQVGLTANGMHVTDWDFDFNSPNVKNQGYHTRRIISLPAGIAPDGVLKLDFEISGTASPEDLGLGPDPRQLGIEIIDLRLIPNQQSIYGSLVKLETNSVLAPITPSVLKVEIEDVFAVPRSSAHPPYAQINMLIHANDGSQRLFVNDMRGYIYVYKKGQKAEIFLDLHSIIGEKLIRYEFEKGLIAFAFHPDFANRQAQGFGRLYTTHTEYTVPIIGERIAYFKSPLVKDYHQDVITEWHIDPSNPDRVLVESGRELMRVGEINRDHNVSHLAFNPNARPGETDYGKLYIAIGDGGDGDNNYADPFDMGQNPSTILGTIARIDPLAAKGKPYQVPEDNPFIGREGFLPEIWAYGFRNPLRMSWDTAGNQALYVSDIGHYNIEEINIIKRGGNYGWSNMEGPFILDRDNNYQLYHPHENSSEDYITPIAMYDHTEGFAVVGGYVYRGKNIQSLQGKYIFGDIKTGRIFYINVDQLEFDRMPARIHELTLTRDGQSVNMLDLINTGNNRVDLRFGQDETGEIYILSKQDGMVRKLVAAPNDVNNRQ